MKRLLILLIVIIAGTVSILFFPRSIEHGVVVSSENKTITLLINGKQKTYNSSVNFPKLTVVNFKYNLFKAYSFKEVSPITERVMMKDQYSYDLEASSKINLSNKVSYYTVDKDNNIKVSDNKSVIVGKNNLKYFKDKKGELKTFLSFPMDYSTMRVGISNTGFSSVYHEKSLIMCTTPSTLYSVRDNFSLDLPKGTPVIIEPEGNTLKLTVNNKTSTYKNRIYLKGDGLTIDTIKRGSPAFTPSYSGILEFTTNENRLCIINEVDLEDYLRKVVPSEMPLSGGVEALKCQAIAARTYAISDMLASRFANLGFYVDDSTRSQVYNNIPMQPLSTEAVNSTKGIIMTYDDIPIDAKYYSTSAGTGVAYKDVWFNPDGTTDDRPYLLTNNYLTPNVEFPKSEEDWLKFYKDTSIKAIDSDYPFFRWKVEYTKAGLTTALNKTLKSLYEGGRSRNFLTIYKNSKEIETLPEPKDLQDIRILKRAEGGIAMEVSFVFSNVTVNVKSDSYIRSSIKCNQEYTNEPTTLLRNKASSLTTMSSLPSAFFSVEKTNDKFILYGGGFGHGAGMSQYGAIELSKKGQKYEDILNTFYKNIKIEKKY